MHEFEKYWNKYIILGYPTFGALIKLALKKGTKPTVYGEKDFPICTLLGLAQFCRLGNLSTDSQICELLIRHAGAFPGKKLILIYTAAFTGFIGRNRDLLEKYFLISDMEGIYEA